MDAGVADPVTGAPIARHVDPSTLPGGGSSAAGGLTHRYFVRNRHYAPDLGRFMQRDPNGTGGVGIESRSSMGGGRWQRVGMLSLSSHLRDGVGVFGALRSSPWHGSDPLGLFDLSLVGLLATSSTTSQLQSDWSQEVIGNGISAGQSAHSAFRDYSFNQLINMSWAEDWNQNDDASTFSPDMHWRSRTVLQAEAVQRGFASGSLIDAIKRAPKRLNVSRNHGDILKHTRNIHDEIRDIYAKHPEAMDNLRMNQGLLSACGQRLGKRRPDIQWLDRNGKVHLVEVLNHQTFAEAKKNLKEMKELLGGQCGQMWIITKDGKEHLITF